MSLIPDMIIMIILFIMYMSMITAIVGEMRSHIGNILIGVTIIAAHGMLVMVVTKNGVIGITLAGGNTKLGGAPNHATSLCPQQSSKIYNFGNCQT